uniref:Uncharacterized protein n=1 Tax=Oryza brachyantha TaxID=4533 RepID=J3M5A0_ORYBR
MGGKAARELEYLQCDSNRDVIGWNEVGRVAPPNPLAGAAVPAESGGKAKEAVHSRGRSPTLTLRFGEGRRGGGGESDVGILAAGGVKARSGSDCSRFDAATEPRSPIDERRRGGREGDWGHRSASAAADRWRGARRGRWRRWKRG